LFSLALALGLAQISSQNIKIETLFLDEGFGTLDEDTLEIALDALNSLHQEGRLIGIISHVAGLKESINTQMVVLERVEEH
jgi:exonuclease SbcC